MLTQQSLKNTFIHLGIHLITHLFSHYILRSCYVRGTEGKKIKETDTLIRRHCPESGRNKTWIMR